MADAKKIAYIDNKLNMDILKKNIETILTHSEPIVIYRPLLEFLDNNVNSAIVLSRLIYWQKYLNEDKWLFKSYREWSAETGLSKYQVSMAIDKLIELNYIHKRLAQPPNSPPFHRILV